MDPFFARNRLSAYLDGSLPEGEAAEVEAAIRDDPGLQAEYDAMRRAVALLRREGPVEAPDGFHARVMAAVADEPAPGKVTSIFHRVFARVPVEAVALAAAAVIVVLVIQGRDEPPAPDEALAERAMAEGADALPQKGSAPPAVTVQGAEQEPAADAGGAEQAQAAAPAAQADGDLRTVAGSGSLEDAPSKSAPATRSDAALSTAKGADRKDKAAPPPQGIRGAAAPEEPYYAGWEKEAPAAEGEAEASTPSELYEGIEMARPFAYRISLADAQVLFQLSAVAEQEGGRLTSPDGKRLAPSELDADAGWTRVHIVVPRDNAQGVHTLLGKLQATATPPPSTPVLYGSDHAVFVIDVSAGGS